MQPQSPNQSLQSNSTCTQQSSSEYECNYETIEIYTEEHQDHQDHQENEINDTIDPTMQQTDTTDNDLDLTNLNWLTELKNITNLEPSEGEKLTDQPTQRFKKFINQVKKIKETYDTKCYDYQHNVCEKPSFNYAQIIAMALLEEGRLTLQQICKWIEDKFAYYKLHKNWNNSIRHNLSLNFFFTKVAREKNDKGKGGYWELAMDVSKSARKRIRQRKSKNHNNNLNNNNNNNNNNLNIMNNNTRLRNKSRFMKMNNDKNREQEQQTTTTVIGKQKEHQIINDINANETDNEDDIMADDKVMLDDKYDTNDDNDDDDTHLDDFNNNEILSSDMELIEEQQNINNIIDDCHGMILIPNVVVEPIPTYQFSQFPQIEIETFNDQDLIDNFLNYNGQHLIDDFLDYDDDSQVVL
ncbi:unnamed protein product [Diamesa serratosioi]